MTEVNVIKETGKIIGLILFGLLLAGLLGWARRYGYVGATEKYYAYLVVFIGWLILVFPVGGIIGGYLRRREPAPYKGPGLQEAGRVIGRLERTIILVFYLAGSLEGIAFLVVAKSIYRFGDLRKGHQNEGEDDGREVTFSISEYIILGSLLSYTCAIVAGFLIKLILGHFGLSLQFVT